MKPLMLIPPAQAEALYDAQDFTVLDGLRDDLRLESLRPEDRITSLPWRDDESPEETPHSFSRPPAPRRTPSFGRVP